ncbi:MAG: hypothetical protein NWE95_02510 [Candidatus Bathyarchaeota archaeon]|nr:hypothetical protein [Candidatus Bathyarchaeota archaeon]
MKRNYFGISAGIVAFVSLLLPWFNIELWTENLSSTMNFAANLYQLTGTVEGTTARVFLMTWFTVGAIILMCITGATALLGSTLIKRKRKLFLIVSCAFALIAMLIFGYGLANSSFAVEEINPGYTISQFPKDTFGLSAEESMQNSYHYTWNAGIGFWLALATAILALVATFMSRKMGEK